MSKGLNKVMIIGSLGDDPEILYTSEGSAVSNLSIATSQQWNDKHIGGAMEKTEWHRITFRRLAEIIGEYLCKGAKVYIEGVLGAPGSTAFHPPPIRTFTTTYPFEVKQP